MKQYIQKNKLLFAMILLLLIVGIIGIIKYEKDYKNLENQYYSALEYSKENNEQYYQQLLKTSPYKADSLSLFTYIAGDSIVGLIDVIGPLIIIIVCGYEIHSHLKSGYIQNIMTRQSYRNYILKIIKNAYLKSLIIPCFWLYFLFLCFLQSKTFIFNSGFGSTFVNNHPFYVLMLYFIYSLIHSFFCANLSLIFNSKGKNFAVNCILGFLTFLGFAFYFNIIFWYGISTYLEINQMMMPDSFIYNCSLMTQDLFQITSGYLPSFLILLFCYLVSLLGLISAYIDKEVVMT